jgi:hypothetical protein
LGNVIRDNKYKYKDIVSGPLNMIPFNQLKIYYSKEDSYQKLNNSWLKESLLITNLSLFIIITVSIYLLTNICNIELDVKELLLLNALTFTGIGIVEYLFFTHVALDYVPTPPSLLIDTIINNTKNYFSQ